MTEREPVSLVWRWDVRDPKRGSAWRRLAWTMSEEDASDWAQVEGVEIRKVAGSREEKRAG